MTKSIKPLRDQYREAANVCWLKFQRDEDFQAATAGLSDDQKRFLASFMREAFFEGAIHYGTAFLEGMKRRQKPS